MAQVDTNIAFTFTDLLTIDTDATITSLSCWETYLYIGTNRGDVYLYQVERHTALEGKSTFDVELKLKTKVSDKSVDNMHVISGPELEYLVIQCGGAVTLHKPLDLLLVFVVPHNCSLFCCNDASSFYGLLVNVGTTLHMFDLQRGFDVSKQFSIPEAPIKMRWTRNLIVLAFRDEYTLLDEETGEVFELLQTERVKPIIKLLPTEDVIVSGQKSVTCTDMRGHNKQRFKLLNQPTSMAFTFPFVYAFCDTANCIEIRSLLDSLFHEVIRGPSSVSTPSKIQDDGRHVFVSQGGRVFVLHPQTTQFQVTDPQLLMNVMQSSPLDKPALVKLITLILTNDSNPFKHLMMKYVERCVTKFVHPERSTIADAKNVITVYLRRIYRSILSFFKEFSTATTREILSLTTQVIFFAHTYGTISAIVKEKFIDQDVLYTRKLKELEGITIADMGIRKRFWLTDESVEAEKIKVADLTSPLRAGRRPSAPTSPMPVLDLMSPIKSQLVEPQQKQPISVSAPASAGMTSAAAGETSPFAISGERRGSTADDLSIKRVGDAILHAIVPETSDYDNGVPVELVQDEDNVLFICNDETGEISELAIGDSRFNFDPDHKAVMWTQDGTAQKLIFADESIFREFCIQYEMYSTQGTGSVNFGASSTMDRPTHARSRSVHFTSLASQPPRNLSLSSASLAQARRDRHSDNSGPHTPETPSALSTRLASESGSSSSSVTPVGSLEERSKSIPNDNLFVPNTPAPAPVSPSKTKSKSIWGDVDNDWVPSPIKKRPSTGGLFAKESDDSVKQQQPDNQIVIPEYDITSDPYFAAIKLLKAISKYKSPREKLECVLKSLNQTVQCVTDFWRKYGKEVIVGADDLVPIFGYVIYRAAVPAMYFEMNFIMEFATEASLRGKYGYALATLQVAVENVNICEPKYPTKTLSSSVNDEEFVLLSSSPETKSGSSSNASSTLSSGSNVGQRSGVKALIEKVDSLNEQKEKEAKASGMETVSDSKMHASKDNLPYEREKFLERFNLPSDQEVLNWFACGVSVRTSGFLYLTKHFLCYENGPGQDVLQLVIPIANITSMRKTWVFLSRSAIEVGTADGRTFIWRSFRNRDDAFVHIERVVHPELYKR